MLLFHFHTLHANALWKVPSRIPPRRRDGGRGRAGMEGSSLAGSASPRGVASTCLPLPAGSGPSGGAWDPLPAHDASRGRPGPARSGEFWARCSRSAPASPEEVLVRRSVPGFLSVLSAAPRGNPERFIRCPTSLSAFQVCAG